MSKFSVRFKELRQESKLSQQALADKTGISKSSINMYERGEREPGIETLELFADFFNVDMDYLIGKSEHRNAHAILAQHTHSYGYSNFILPDSQSKEIGLIIRKLRGDLSLREFADKCGISHTTIDNLEKGIDFRTGKPTQVKMTTLSKIADACDVPITIFVNDIPKTDTPRPRKNVLRVPVYGQVAAGVPIEAIEDIEDYEELDADQYPSGEYIALRIHGHSMEPRMMEGDVVIVRLQDDVDTGDTAIIMVNGGEATCKKIKKTLEGVTLISTNPVYEPMFYSNQEIWELPVRVLGKVVELRAKY